MYKTIGFLAAMFFIAGIGSITSPDSNIADKVCVLFGGAFLGLVIGAIADNLTLIGD